MEIPIPQIYDLFVRPKWITKKYIHNHLNKSFQFNQQVVLDFGCGTGANCNMFSSTHYLGLDIDPKRVDYAKQLYPDHSFQVMGGDYLPVKDATIHYIVIIAVLHHISSQALGNYIKEFRRILKPNGTVVVMEPFYCENKPLCNLFMEWFDAGKYIRKEAEYLHFFIDNNFTCNIIKKFQKCILYNELFFSATLLPKSTT